MKKRIDHLVIVDRDLGALSDAYQRLGFQVGTRNRHDWGTENTIVQFDGAFLELLSTGDGFVAPADDAPVAPFALPITRYLERHGAGLAMLVLSSDDAKADQARYEAAGIAAGREVFWFGREGAGADGTPTQVAFSLSFAESPAMPDAGFFVCQQHFPENFWFADRQIHDNAVTGLRCVTLQADDPAAAAPFMAAFTNEVATARNGWSAPAFHMANGIVQLATADDVAKHYADMAPTRPDGGFVATHFATRDLAQTEETVRAAGFTYAVADGRMIVAADEGHGQVLVFEAVA
ncbi:MAG: VOC family protein [Pseudomonadota bacterium]